MWPFKTRKYSFAQKRYMVQVSRAIRPKPGSIEWFEEEMPVGQRIVKIDGCQYIALKTKGAWVGDYKYSITHKGNCSNKIHYLAERPLEDQDGL